MADKPILNYKGYMTDNPADRQGPKLCVPQIVDRNQVVDLTSVVKKAIDRGLIAGLKSSAAKAIADGIMLQLGETLNNGTGVIFGEFFSVRPYLTGTIADILAPLTAQNVLRVRFVPGSAYKLDGKNFSFHNVTQSENVPSISGVQARNDHAPEDSWSVIGVVISGKNLQLDAGDTLNVYGCDGETPVLKEAYRYEDFGNLGFMDNATNITIPEGVLGELELGTKAGFKVVRTITVEGVETSIESKMYVATKYTAA